MTREEALATVRRILAEHLGLDAPDVVPEANLRDDLGLDSLDALDLIGAVQEHTGSVDLEQLNTAASVGDLIDIMVARTAAGSPS